MQAAHLPGMIDAPTCRASGQACAVSINGPQQTKPTFSVHVHGIRLRHQGQHHLLLLWLLWRRLLLVRRLFLLLLCLTLQATVPPVP
jgi:hypothetical protein